MVSTKKNWTTVDDVMMNILNNASAWAIRENRRDLLG
jgi:hypothetical protein